MFYTHGNPVAVLVTETSAGHRQSHKRVAGPQAALEWCIKHHATFIYLPVDPSLN